MADAFPAQPFDAELYYLAPAVDPQRGTVETRFRVPAAPPFLRPDMTVSVETITGHRDATLVLPAEAVRDPDSGKPWAIATVSPAVKTITTSTTASAPVAASPAVATVEVVTPVALASTPAPAVRNPGRAASSALQITIKAKGFGETELFAHIGRDGWQQAVDVPMAKRSDGSFSSTYSVKPGLYDINVALHDRQGNWYTNGGDGWTFTVAGNGEQTIVITR